MECPCRGDGAAAEISFVHESRSKSYIHVSPLRFSTGSLPPKSRIRSEALTYTIRCRSRMDGAVAGLIFVHVDACGSYAHVSLLKTPSRLPPNRTTFPEPPSYATPEPARGDGDTLGGLRGDQRFASRS